MEPLPISLNFNKSSGSFFPPSISMYDIHIHADSFKEPLHVDKLKLAPSLFKWLSLVQAWKISLTKEGLPIHFIISRKTVKKNKTKQKELYVNVYSSLLNMQVFKSFLSNFNINGNIQFDLEMEGREADIFNGEGSLQIRGKRIQILESKVPTNLGPLQLPNLAWKEAVVQASVSKNKLRLEKVVLGSDEDDFFLQLRGDMDIRLNRGRVHIGSYDLQLFIETVQDFKFPLIDLMLESTKSQIPRGWRYLARIVGRGSKAPDIEKLSEF